MDVKTIIRNRRIDLGLTMKDIADAVGVSEATVSRWESGEIENMRRDKIAALAKVLQLEPGVIMGWEPDVSSQLGRLMVYKSYFERLNRLEERDRLKALKLIDGVIKTFED